MFSFLFHFHISQFLIVFAVWSSLWQSGKQSLFKSQPASSWKNIKFQLNTMIDVNYNVLRTQGLIAEGVGTNWGGARSMLQTWLRWRSGSSWIRGLAVIRACVLHSCPTAASIHMESPKFFLSLRFGSDVKRTQAVLATVVARHKKKNMPDPILYYRNYRNGREVKKDWPDIPCLLGI